MGSGPCVERLIRMLPASGAAFPSVPRGFGMLGSGWSRACWELGSALALNPLDGGFGSRSGADANGKVGILSRWGGEWGLRGCFPWKRWDLGAGIRSCAWERDGWGPNPVKTEELRNSRRNSTQTGPIPNNSPPPPWPFPLCLRFSRWILDFPGFAQPGLRSQRDPPTGLKPAQESREFHPSGS